jgi:hypothetical protein
MPRGFIYEYSSSHNELVKLGKGELGGSSPTPACIRCCIRRVIQGGSNRVQDPIVETPFYMIPED